MWTGTKEDKASPHHAEEIWKCSFVSTSGSTVHTNPSRKRSSDRRNLKTLAFRFPVDERHFWKWNFWRRERLRIRSHWCVSWQSVDRWPTVDWRVGFTLLWWFIDDLARQRTLSFKLIWQRHLTKSATAFPKMSEKGATTLISGAWKPGTGEV